MIERDLPPSARRGLARTSSALARGMSIAEAGENSGVWLPWEARAISAAAASGRLESLFANLSTHYARRSKLFARIRSRLVFPMLILLLASFVAPFPALFQGMIGTGGYLLRAIGPLLLLYSSLRLLVSAYRRQLANETGAVWARLILAIPVFGGLLARQQRRDGLLILLLLLESGTPVLEALPLAGQSVANPLLRARYLTAAKALASERSSVAETLERYGLVGDPGAVALFASGEVAGRLDEMIRHQLRQWDDQLELQWYTLAEWVPRLIYAAVAGFMAMGIFGGYQGLTSLVDAP